MDKKDLTKMIDEIFIPIGFKRKGNSWVNNGVELSKVVNLQKSNYSNSFYINYGYNIEGLETTTFLLHIYHRLTDEDKAEREKIVELLDFENNVDTIKRLTKLKSIIMTKIVNEMILINTIEELKMQLKHDKYLNTTPALVKEYLELD